MSYLLTHASPWYILPTSYSARKLFCKAEISNVSSGVWMPVDTLFTICWTVKMTMTSSSFNMSISGTPKCLNSIRLSLFLIAAVLIMCINSYSFPRGMNSVKKTARHLQIDSNTYIPLLVSTPKVKKWVPGRFLCDVYNSSPTAYGIRLLLEYMRIVGQLLV